MQDPISTEDSQIIWRMGHPQRARHSHPILLQDGRSYAGKIVFALIPPAAQSPVHIGDGIELIEFCFNQFHFCFQGITLREQHFEVIGTGRPESSPDISTEAFNTSTSFALVSYILSNLSRLEISVTLPQRRSIYFAHTGTRLVSAGCWRCYILPWSHVCWWADQPDRPQQWKGVTWEFDQVSRIESLETNGAGDVERRIKSDLGDLQIEPGGRQIQFCLPDIPDGFKQPWRKSGWNMPGNLFQNNVVSLAIDVG